MPQTDKDKPEVLRATTSFNDLLLNLRFIEYTKGIKKLPKEKWPDNIAALMLDFGIPSNASRFVSHYIKTGQQDPTLIISTIGFLDEPNQELFWSDFKHDGHDAYVDWVNNWDVPRIALLINHETTQPELVDYIVRNWTKIKEKVDSSDGRNLKQHRRGKNKLRNAEILRLYLNGEKPKDIALKYDELEPHDVNKIIYNIKKHI